ncbi:hypothetical protein LQ318_08280 [Aliifodinibius salicampi]|uniref:Uncharacterized protein n=1 Tax=Fodinibius salicampi TaxID=1920655 RepID=A0ABT3PYF5_9BACT|nr:hypothetical protein [Fodinibius salicampi]MCW9712900.1 hypothetical protein [Fodinibius salicampi]
MAPNKNRSEYKNDWQNTVVATFVSGLLLVVIFLCPWRVESTGELRWSPIYQQPMSYVQSYDGQRGRQGGSQIVSEKAHIAYEILALEVLIFTITGGILYMFSAGSNSDEGEKSLPGQ